LAQYPLYLEFIFLLEHCLHIFGTLATGATVCINLVFFELGSRWVEQNKGDNRSNPYTALFRQVPVLQIVGIP
jgi:hypothetical protein